MRTIYCIYHSVDLDGWTSAAIVLKKFGEKNVTLIPWTHGDDPPELDLPGNDVIIVDLSFSNELLHDWILNANQVIWIDHHKSAIEKYESYDRKKELEMRVDFDCSLDTSMAACELTWKYFNSTRMPLAVLMLGKYDSFRHVGTKEESSVWGFQLAARAWISSPQEALSVFSMGNDEIVDWIRMGAAIDKFKKREISNMLREGVEMSGTTVGNVVIINGDRINPKSYGMVPDAFDTIICYSIKSSDLVIFTIYSDSFDVSKVAIGFGGGGHAGAAGWGMNILQLKDLLDGELII